MLMLNIIIDNSGSTNFLLLRFATPVRLEDAKFNTGWHSMNDTEYGLRISCSTRPALGLHARQFPQKADRQSSEFR